MRFCLPLLVAATLLIAANAPTAQVTVDCNQSAGTMKGIHRSFSGGFSTYAKTENLKPFIEQIGASHYRLPILRSGTLFKGKTFEDAQNPEMYDFSEADEFAGKVDALGMRLFATIAHIPPQLSETGTPKGACTGENLRVFAEVVKHAVLHLTQGWANGHHYPIQYWEIWNEGDLSERPEVRGAFWTGTQEQLFELYAAVARAITSIEPLPGQEPYKVGGPAFAHLTTWHEPFLAFCDKNELPLDFFSFHHYDDNPEGFLPVIQKAHDAVRAYPRFAKTELILDEWNMAVGPWGEGPPDKKDMDMVFYVICNPKFSEPEGAVHLARTLILFERSPLAMAHHFLLADNGIAQMGVISCPEIPIPPRPADAPAPTDGCTPKKKFEVLKLFKALFATPELVKVTVDDSDMDAMAGMDAEKKTLNLLLVNWGPPKDVQIVLNAASFAAGTKGLSYSVLEAGAEEVERGSVVTEGSQPTGAPPLMDISVDAVALVTVTAE